MGIDLQMLQAEKGGDIAAVLASQKKRFASEELVNEVLALYTAWTKTDADAAFCSAARSRLPAQPAPKGRQRKAKGHRNENEGTPNPTTIFHAAVEAVAHTTFLFPPHAQNKEDATELKAEKAELDKKVLEMGTESKKAEEIMRRKAQSIGNIVHESVPIAQSEDDNRVERTYHPDGLTPNGEMTKPLHGVGRTMTEGILSHDEVMFRLDILE
ncbi:hypothetical protein P7C70_g8038, partial [Phenoliferia sp. Uapishka_3]